MKTNRFLRIHNILWLTYLTLFFGSPFDYKVEGETVATVIGLLIIGNIFFVIGWNSKCRNNTILGRDTFKINISKTYRFLVALSILYFILNILKYGSLQSTFEFNISLAGFTELRMAMDSEDYVKGNNVFGVLASLFAGFPLLTIPFLFAYINKLDKLQKFILFIVIVGYLASTFTSGGRNGALVVLLVLFFSIKVISGSKKIRVNIITIKLKLTLIALIIILFFSFAKIFIDRAELRSGSINDYIIFAQATHAYELKPYANDLLNNDNVNFFYFPLFLFHDYFVHSLKEFEITINNQPPNFPYYGAYEFYTFTLLLNKFGFEFIAVEDILSEIPNPGRYLTLYGGLYLDFGLIGMAIVVSFLYFLTGKMLRSFLETGSLISLFWAIYFYVIIFLSPIFSVIGISMYPGFLVAIIVCSIIFRTSFLKPQL